MDDLWVGVKSQTNLEISGSPRNSSKGSLEQMERGGRALDDLGGLTAYQSQLNYKYRATLSRE
ncbi:MAG: hypothetical protein B1H03_04695 [Planctomycetales bacterium 4484_113]|nr:MAG: hypothetical protein B1H03_04695 [Planctomycetales bacterium 4484_113]